MNQPFSDHATTPREQIPALIGQLAEAQARLWLRLLAVPAQDAPTPSRLLVPDEAARMANVSTRWLLQRTRGLSFRRDLSRKNPRFDEVGFRRWLEGRR